MARALRLAKAERDFLKANLADQDVLALMSAKECKLAASIVEKVAASEERLPGVDAGPLEDALLKASRGKVVRLEGEGAYGRASRQAGQVGATVADATLVGEWMARQGWMHGPQTIIDVLNKWAQWVPKARATQPPPTLQPGLGANEQQRVPPPVGKTPPGFK